MPRLMNRGKGKELLYRKYGRMIIILAVDSHLYFIFIF